jgi:predicted membrane channel-forming protein YqfA (hemolysin III family)
MFDPFNYPWIVLGVSVLSFWAAARIGVSIQKWRRSENEATRDDFTLLIGATLTLLGLIIGFTFSMAVERYDQRKNLEEEEANAIGTEYVRANLLPAADAEKLRGMLKNYLDQRIAVYSIPDSQERRQVMTQTAKLQNELWSAVQAPAMAQPQAAAMLILSGMNDVLNSQGYTQAAWWNRIPVAAWILLIAISIFCNLLLGYGLRAKSGYVFLILPIALSISLFLIADIDSPRRGIIHVRPQNLEALAESLRSQ